MERSNSWRAVHSCFWACRREACCPLMVVTWTCCSRASSGVTGRCWACSLATSDSSGSTWPYASTSPCQS